MVNRISLFSSETTRLCVIALLLIIFNILIFKPEFTMLFDRNLPNFPRSSKEKKYTNSTEQNGYPHLSCFISSKQNVFKAISYHRIFTFFPEYIHIMIAQITFHVKISFFLNPVFLCTKKKQILLFKNITVF